MESRRDRRETMTMSSKKMSKDEFLRNVYKDNSFKCGFCGKEVRGKIITTLCCCKGLGGYDIADICDDCLEEFEKKVIF